MNNSQSDRAGDIMAHNDAHRPGITLLLGLGPNQVVYHIPHVDLPQTSSGFLSGKHGRRPMLFDFPDLDPEMIDTYRQMKSADLLATDSSWLDIIKLFITADDLQDETVAVTALDALKKKATITELFTQADYTFAQTHYSSISGCLKLEKTLDSIAQSMGAKARFSKIAKEVPVSGHIKYGNSALRGKVLSSLVRNKGDGKEHPVRQPTIPPSVEALRTGEARNFVWPTRGEKKEKEE